MMPGQGDQNLHSSGNYFDNLIVDVPKLYTEFPVTESADSKYYEEAAEPSALGRLYRNPLLPLKWRTRIWAKAFQTRWDLAWFEEFSTYWTKILGGRPLWSVDDLYFLKNHYRIKFQSASVSESAESQDHLFSWQSPELLYQLLHLVCKQTASIDAFLIRSVFRLLERKSGIRWLEFGCGTAPITSALLQFFGHLSSNQLIISDIETLAFHYASYRLSRYPNIRPVALKKETNFRLDINTRVDVVFCVQVFEHLQHPLRTASEFWDVLNPGGLLVFDYLPTEGTGLDTRQGFEQRNATLDYLLENFDLVSGEKSRLIETGALCIFRRR